MIINIKKYIGEFRPLKRYFDSDLNDYVPQDCQLFASVPEGLLQYKRRGKWTRWSSPSHARAMMKGVYQAKGFVEPTQYNAFSAGPFAPAFASVAEDEIDVDPDLVSPSAAAVPSLDFAENMMTVVDNLATTNITVNADEFTYDQISIVFSAHLLDMTTIPFANEFILPESETYWNGATFEWEKTGTEGSMLMPTFSHPDSFQQEIIPLTDKSYLYDVGVIGDMSLHRQQIPVSAIDPTETSLDIILRDNNQNRLRNVNNTGSAVTEAFAVQNLVEDTGSGTNDVFRTAACT